MTIAMATATADRSFIVHLVHVCGPRGILTRGRLARRDRPVVCARPLRALPPARVSLRLGEHCLPNRRAVRVGRGTDVDVLAGQGGALRRPQRLMSETYSTLCESARATRRMSSSAHKGDIAFRFGPPPPSAAGSLGSYFQTGLHNGSVIGDSGD